MQDRACEAEVVLCGSQVSECRPVGVIERRGDILVPACAPGGLVGNRNVPFQLAKRLV